MAGCDGEPEQLVKQCTHRAGFEAGVAWGDIDRVQRVFIGVVKRNWQYQARKAQELVLRGLFLTLSNLKA